MVVLILLAGAATVFVVLVAVDLARVDFRVLVDGLERATAASNSNLDGGSLDALERLVPEDVGSAVAVASCFFMMARSTRLLVVPLDDDDELTDKLLFGGCSSVLVLMCFPKIIVEGQLGWKQYMEGRMSVLK